MDKFRDGRRRTTGLGEKDAAKRKGSQEPNKIDTRQSSPGQDGEPFWSNIIDSSVASKQLVGHGGIRRGRTRMTSLAVVVQEEKLSCQERIRKPQKQD